MRRKRSTWTYLKKSKDLQLRDRVKVTSDAYGCATVKQIKDGFAHCVRPYIHAEDFEYTGGVITYIGYEEFPLHMGEDEVEVYGDKPKA
jgi:hypothetical protein